MCILLVRILCFWVDCRVSVWLCLSLSFLLVYFFIRLPFDSDCGHVLKSDWSIQLTIDLWCITPRCNDHIIAGVLLFEGWFGMFCIKLGLASFCMLEWIMLLYDMCLIELTIFLVSIKFYAYSLQVKFEITSVYFATRNSFCWFNAFDQIVTVDEIWTEVASLSQYLPCWNSIEILKFGWFKTCSYSCI